ncbi:hypothetical protein H4Q26_000164 [Puccinia striiformis f. sp. tritici PST-130]|nr:hypothetical protein H4Q26_000164 [Puccinia striiformis f. sp. tritici PST-130]
MSPSPADHPTPSESTMVPFPMSSSSSSTQQLFTHSSKLNPLDSNSPAHSRSVLTPLKDSSNRSEANNPMISVHNNNKNHYVHPPINNVATEPTMSELLAATGDNGLVSWRKGQGFRAWESAILANPEVQRKANVAQLYFYDHYFDLLTYLNGRKKRLALFRENSTSVDIDPSQAGKEWRSYCGRERALLRKRRTKLKLDSFHIIVQVGQGGYGEVFLARHKLSKEVVALKKMKKKTLLKMDEVRHVLTERDILTATSKSDWLVKLLYAFQDPDYIYLAMEFVPGGDVRTLLNNSGVLKEEHAKFYATEMFVAVDSLHKLGYIHRDLKPENFLIDRSGHIKLTDFGLAAGSINPGKIQSLKHRLDDAKDENLQLWKSTVEMKTIYKTLRLQDPRYADSIVGSPDYMAIEVLRGQSYSFSVDYWSLGCILFEFLSGYAHLQAAIPKKHGRIEELEQNSEIDAGYFDDFGNPEEMKKYGEVFEKARAVEAVEEIYTNPGSKDKNNCRGVWVGFTFKGGKTAELLRGAVPSSSENRTSGGNAFEFGEDDTLECMF